MRTKPPWIYSLGLVIAVMVLSSCSRHEDTVVLKLARVLDTGHSVHQGMGYYDSGSRSIYMVDTPVETPADIQGKKIRVMKSQTAVKMVSALNEHTSVPDMLLMSSRIWNSLGEQQQKWLQMAVDDSVAFQRELWWVSTEEALAAVQSPRQASVRL